MISLFNIFGVICWVAGIGACNVAKGAIHESNGLVLCLIGSVFLVGAAIIDELRKGRAKKIPPEALLGPGDKPPETTIPYRRGHEPK